MALITRLGEWTPQESLRPSVSREVSVDVHHTTAGCSPDQLALKSNWISEGTLVSRAQLPRQVGDALCLPIMLEGVLGYLGPSTHP